MFLFDLAIQFGKETVEKTLKAVYDKYRYTNLTKITDRNFFDAFMYYINKDRKDQSSQAKQLLQTKLCVQPLAFKVINPYQYTLMQYTPLEPVVVQPLLIEELKIFNWVELMIDMK